MDSRAIGIFDSGLGGLSIWRAVRDRLPGESIIYLGDGLNCPYGERSQQEIIELSIKATNELIVQGCKLIVVACNTATIASIATLREMFPTTLFVGVEPAVKPACFATKSGKIGVLATEWSISKRHYMERVASYRADVEVVNAVGRGFVELVEEQMESTPIAIQVVRPIVEELISKGVDQIVLGCTHYPFLQDSISEIVGDKDIAIINPAPSVACQVERLLSDNSLLNNELQEPIYKFITFSNDDYAQMLEHMACSL
ncbi:MAG: glutamate racemase [Rikenellaceae bacterium]